MRDGFREPCAGSTIAATFRPSSSCRCPARKLIRSMNTDPVPNPCTQTTQGRGRSVWRSSHAEAVRLDPKAFQRSAPGMSGGGSYPLGHHSRS